MNVVYCRSTGQPIVAAMGFSFHHRWSMALIVAPYGRDLLYPYPYSFPLVAKEKLRQCLRWWAGTPAGDHLPERYQQPAVNIVTGRKKKRVNCPACGSEMFPPWHEEDRGLFQLICTKCGRYLPARKLKERQ
jgi:ribosomal protein S27AE